MIRSFKTKTVALAAVGVLGLGGGAYAATSSSDAPTPITGSITDKAAEAAVAKVPGSTLVGLVSRPDGTFEAQVRKSDGSPVAVTLDKDLKVTDTREGGPAGGPGGPGPFGPAADTAALAKALGVTEDKLRDAMKATRPAKGERRDERATAIAKALGVDASDVQSVLEDRRPGGDGAGAPPAPGAAPTPGAGPGPAGRPDRGEHRDALVAALAKKTGKSEDAVRSALKAARPDPDAHLSELATALAKELGLDADKVKSALEAQRPAGRP